MKKRLIVLLCLIELALVACDKASPAEIPTPLPTAVPPTGDSDGWGIGFRHEFPPEFWGEGNHRYAFLVHCPVLSAENIPTEWQYFQVSEEAQLRTGPIYLRVGGLSTEPLKAAYRSDIVVHPAQQTIAALYFVGMSQESAERAATECEAVFLWDNKFTQPLTTMESFQP